LVAQVAQQESEMQAKEIKRLENRIKRLLKDTNEIWEEMVRLEE
jgi:hypothetical protein